MGVVYHSFVVLCIFETQDGRNSDHAVLRVRGVIVAVVAVVVVFKEKSEHINRSGLNHTQ